MSADSPGRREVAYRLFADEYDDANFSYSESDEERAPNYVVTPTGARVNRLFVVGVLTEIEQVGDDILRARVVDPTGAFVLYAGQYQPDEQAFLERTDPPAFVAVTGKARTFQPEDSDRVYTSIRPESINRVDAETRDRWTVQAAEQTLDRVAHVARAIASGNSGAVLREELEAQGVDSALADGIPRALEQYGTTAAYLDAVRTMALDAARVVAGERDDVRGLTLAPGDPGDVTAADLVSATRGTERTEDSVTEMDAAETETTVDPATEVAAAETETTDDSATEMDVAEIETTDDQSAPTEMDLESETPASSSRSADEDPSTEEVTTDAPAQDADSGEREDQSPAADADDDIGEFDPEEFDLDEETREEIETEYGTDFQSGTEVDDPGEADIETPGEEESGESGPDTGSEREREVDDHPDVPADSEESAADAETSIDPQEAVLSIMRELDEGDGANREAVISEANERHGLTSDEVADVIQTALMDGQCYEPDESSLKPI